MPDASGGASTRPQQTELFVGPALTMIGHGLQSTLLGLRILLRETVPIVEQTDFVPYSAGASAAPAQVPIGDLGV